MKTTSPVLFVPKLCLFLLRGQRVLLDVDLARLYGVPTRMLNQIVWRHPDRFPLENAFQLTREEIFCISQKVTGFNQLKFSKCVNAFTENGAMQAATVLNSPEFNRLGLGVFRQCMNLREEFTSDVRFLKQLAGTSWARFRQAGASRQNESH